MGNRRRKRLPRQIQICYSCNTVCNEFCECNARPRSVVTNLFHDRCARGKMGLRLVRWTASSRFTSGLWNFLTPDTVLRDRKPKNCWCFCCCCCCCCCCSCGCCCCCCCGSRCLKNSMESTQLWPFKTVLRYIIKISKRYHEKQRCKVCGTFECWKCMVVMLPYVQKSRATNQDTST